MLSSLSTREAFLQSFIHQDYVILGRQLLPFCLRHYLLLMAIRSPFVVGGTIKLEDMRIISLVCSTASNRDFFRAARFDSFYWKLWKRTTRLYSLAKSIQTFNQYIRDYIPSFPRWNTAETTEGERVPGLFLAAARMLNGCTPDYVMNMPLGELLAWNHAIRESTGYPDENLMTDVEYSILKDNPAFAEAIP